MMISSEHKTEPPLRINSDPKDIHIAFTEMEKLSFAKDLEIRKMRRRKNM